jgi:hypothetical protein
MLKDANGNSHISTQDYVKAMIDQVKKPTHIRNALPWGIDVVRAARPAEGSIIMRNVGGTRTQLSSPLIFRSRCVAHTATLSSFLLS